jgi:hypothetical protein
MAAIVHLNHPAHVIIWHLQHVRREPGRDRGDADGLRARDRAFRSRTPGTRETSMSSNASARRARRSWTVAFRERAVEARALERLLTDRQPSYVSSWISDTSLRASICGRRVVLLLHGHPPVFADAMRLPSAW